MSRFRSLNCVFGAVSLAVTVLSWPKTAAAQSDAKATTEPATRVQGVTVTAPPTPDSPQEARRKAQQFVQSHGAPTRIGRLARWRDPVCPVTVGLDPAFNAFVSARVKSVAATVGAPVSKGPCHAINILVVFTAQPQDFLNRIAAKAPVLLGYHDVSQARKLATFGHPIQAWYGTATRSDWGEEAIDDAGGGRPIGSSDLVNGPMGHRGFRPDDSRISNGLGSTLAITLIVADINQVTDHEIGGISDYITMIALSQPLSLQGCDAFQSILDLMSPQCGDRAKPSTLTTSDVDYLKALYATGATISASMAKSNIASKMVSDVEQH